MSDKYDEAASECLPCECWQGPLRHESICPVLKRPAVAAKMRELCAEKDAEIEQLVSSLKSINVSVDNLEAHVIPKLDYATSNFKTMVAQCDALRAEIERLRERVKELEDRTE